MKKIVIVIIAAILVFLAGFTAGFSAYDKAEKYVVESDGLQIIITEFLGNNYEAIAEKESYHFNAFIFDIARR